MKNKSKQKFKIRNFKEVNFAYKDVRWYFDIEEIDQDYIFFSINTEIEFLEENKFELFLHTQFFHEMGEKEEPFSILHLDFVCEFSLKKTLFTKYAKKETKSIPLAIINDILQEVINYARGYYMARTYADSNYYLLPKIDIDKLLAEKKCVKNGFYHISENEH